MTTSLGAPSKREVTNALIAMLKDQTGHPVGDHEAPGPINESSAYPYSMVYWLTHGPTVGDSGKIVAPDREQLLVYQVTSIGLTRDQCDALGDKVRFAITAITTNPNGWLNEIAGDNVKVIDRTNNSSSGTGREGEVWRCSDRFQFMATVRGDGARF